MPGPRRRKPPKHNFPPLTLPPGSNEKWIQEWIDFGFSRMSERLSKQMQFEHYYETREKEESVEDP